MSNTSVSPEKDIAVQPAPEKNMPYVGLVTRAISWVVDALLINLVAIIVGVGVELIASIFPITKSLKPVFVAAGAALYIVWTAGYFVVFWSMSGQTPGARVMQVRLVTPGGGRVKPVRALVRWIGMNLALLPLPWGYVPIPFERLGFPDWLAHTRVIEAPQLSLAEARQKRMRETRQSSGLPSPPADEEIADQR